MAVGGGDGDCIIRIRLEHNEPVLLRSLGNPDSPSGELIVTRDSLART